jgi:hypothetical protein
LDAKQLRAAIQKAKNVYGAVKLAPGISRYMLLNKPDLHHYLANGTYAADTRFAAKMVDGDLWID